MGLCAPQTTHEDPAPSAQLATLLRLHDGSAADVYDAGFVAFKGGASLDADECAAILDKYPFTAVQERWAGWQSVSGS